MREASAAVQSDELFRLLVESVKDYAIFLLDPDGYVRSWNAGAERIKGYRADEIIGQHFSVFYPERDRARDKPGHALSVASSEGRYEDYDWRVRKDGTQFWANVVITALRDEAGELVGYAKVTRDLTERKRADDERASLEAVTTEALAHLDLEGLLSALLERIASALSADTVAVLLLEEKENVLVARAARGIEEEVERGVRIPIGHGFAGRIASEARPVVLEDVEHSTVLNPLLREKGIRSLVGVPLIARGRVIGVLHVGSLALRRFQPRDVQFLEIVADRVALAVEHARLYEEARQARSEANAAEQALRLRDEFISIAAHELKTPMTSAKAAAQLVTRSFRATPLTPTQQRSLEIIDRQITKLARLVVQLLDTVRIESGKLQIDRAQVDLVRLVQAVANDARVLTERHEIVVDAPDELMANIDELRIEQVVTNLLDNAIKYTPEGGRIDVRVKPSGANVVITVRDRGLGVPPEHRNRLFDRFYQAHPDRSGMGLGLYITRQIVERHGGTIYAEAPSDGGTRFVVSIPRD
ncbi:MAG TPA: ATP-binding protein [Candidatus Limnocylindria bacterium]